MKRDEGRGRGRKKIWLRIGIGGGEVEESGIGIILGWHRGIGYPERRKTESWKDIHGAGEAGVVGEGPALQKQR